MAPSPDPEPTAPASGEALASPRRSQAPVSWARFNQGALPTLLAGVVTGLMLFFFNEASNRMTRIEDRITRLEERIDARFAAVDARFVRLEENQQEIAQTLATLVALFEAHNEDER